MWVVVIRGRKMELVGTIRLDVIALEVEQSLTKRALSKQVTTSSGRPVCDAAFPISIGGILSC